MRVYASALEDTRARFLSFGAVLVVLVRGEPLDGAPPRG
jgi:hypothetical protein